MAARLHMDQFVSDDANFHLQVWHSSNSSIPILETVHSNCCHHCMLLNMGYLFPRLRNQILSETAMQSCCTAVILPSLIDSNCPATWFASKANRKHRWFEQKRLLVVIRQYHPEKGVGGWTARGGPDNYPSKIVSDTAPYRHHKHVH